MSSSSPPPTQTPSQIFAHLMATGAIDRFRKSLEKLINPLSQARHQSISLATESFLHSLPSAQHVISNPKQLLQDAKHATMTSVREDVIKDVQQTAVSDAAADLRRALRHAFDNIVNPPKEQPTPAPQSIQSSPSQPSTSQPQPTHDEPPANANANAPFSLTAKSLNPEQENKDEAPKQTLSVSNQTPPANNQNGQQSQRSREPEIHIRIKTPESLPKQNPLLNKNESTPRMHTIPTDLFQTAHNILELKEKEKEAGSSAAKENKKSESTHTQAAKEHPSPSRSDGQTLEEDDRPTSKSPGDHQGEATNSIALRGSPHRVGKEEAAEEHAGDAMNESNVGQSSWHAPETSAEKGSARAKETTEVPRRKHGVTIEPKSTSVVESELVQRMEDNIPDEIKTAQTERRKRRKSLAKLEADHVGTHKRRRKSQLQREARAEGEEDRVYKRKRGRKETAPAPLKKPLKARRQNDSLAGTGSERFIEKRSSRKRGKGSEKAISPAVAALVDPQNPNRRRGYEVSKPSYVPEDYEAQARVLQILENLLESEYSSPFAEPVDLGDEGQSSYLREIRNPMDLGTIVRRLKEGTRQLGFFNNVNEVLADIELVWWNCAHFNGAFDPIVEDMNRCKAELTVHIESSVLIGEKAVTQKLPSTTNEESDKMLIETREERPQGHLIASNVRRKQQVNRSRKVPSDLNDGRLLGKPGVIFRYVEDEAGNKRKEWSSCQVTDYDATSRSYTLRWGDETETKNATIGVGCMFNIHRFRTD